MRGCSFYGTGLMQLGLRRDNEGELETTRWVTLVFVPVIPLSRWRVRYMGMASQLGPDNDESFVFRTGGAIATGPLRCDSDRSIRLVPVRDRGRSGHGMCLWHPAAGHEV